MPEGTQKPSREYKELYAGLHLGWEGGRRGHFAPPLGNFNPSKLDTVHCTHAPQNIFQCTPPPGIFLNEPLVCMISVCLLMYDQGSWHDSYCFLVCVCVCRPPSHQPHTAPQSGMGMVPGVMLSANHSGEQSMTIPVSDIVKQLDLAASENLRLRQRLQDNNDILDRKLKDIQECLSKKDREKDGNGYYSNQQSPNPFSVSPPCCLSTIPVQLQLGIDWQV